MENSKRVASSIVTVLVGGLVVACGGTGTVTAPPAPGQAVEPNVILCGDYDALGDREHYVLPAINRKLRYYPEFAGDIGVESVSTCDEARAFRKSYYEYLALHPDFDAEQPLGPIPGVADEPGQGPPPTLEVGKVRGGLSTQWAYPNAAVVRLTRHPIGLPPNVTVRRCTGTFVARNFIITAAHCLAVTTSQSIPANQAVADDLFGYPKEFQWEVDWPDVNGNAVSTATLRQRAPDVLQLPHPDYMGSGLGEHDIALLYLNPHIYDLKLPGNVHDGAAMRISLTPVGAPEHAGVPSFFAGFASPHQADSSPPNPLNSATLDALRFGQILAPQLMPFKVKDPVVFPNAPEMGDPNTPPPQGTQARLCEGDSGGPAYRFANVLVRTQPGSAGTVRQVPILQANNVDYEIGPQQRDHVNQDDRCSQLGDANEWVRVDGGGEPTSDAHAKLGFVTANVELYKAACHRGALSGGGAEDFVQCWGNPCREISDCAATEYCNLPIGGSRDPAFMGECRPK